MVAEVKMPALSPTMEKGKIISWNKNEGDNVNVGDVILEVETDKAIMEVEAQEKGVIGKILANIDEVISVGEVIALILEKNENPDVLEQYTITKNEENKNNIENNSKQTSFSQETAEKNNTNNTDCFVKNKTFASPLAKKIAIINNIEITNIGNGSGPNGRIIKEDIEKFLSNNNQHKNSINNNVCRNKIEYTDIEPTGMRKTIANRLTESKQQIPHWYLTITADMLNFVNFRSEINKIAKIIDGKPEYKISANDIIVMIIAYVLKRHPEMNAVWNNGKIRQYNNIDIAVACSIDGGILTPVLKNADHLSLLELSSQIKQLVIKARNGNLSPNEYNGGTITVSNLGMYDVEEFCSIINPPQSCIVAVGMIKNQVVATNDNQIAVKPMCKITFSADHRIIDGNVLAIFAKDVKSVLENPALMLI